MKTRPIRVDKEVKAIIDARRKDMQSVTEVKITRNDALKDLLKNAGAFYTPADMVSTTDAGWTPVEMSSDS